MVQGTGIQSQVLDEKIFLKNLVDKKYKFCQ